MEALKVLVLAEVLSCQREPTGAASRQRLAASSASLAAY